MRHHQKKSMNSMNSMNEMNEQQQIHKRLHFLMHHHHQMKLKFSKLGNNARDVYA
jgi:hypothetical protein